jgi:hypothetical protein
MPSQEKKLANPISKNKIGVVIHTYNDSYAGNVGKMITVPGQPEQKPQDHI